MASRHPTACSLFIAHLAGAAILLAPFPAHTADRGSALAELKEAMSQAIAVARDPARGEEEKLVRLRQVVTPRVDFDAMVQSVLGSRRPATEREAAEFRELFIRLLEERYIRRVWFAEAVGGEFIYLREQMEGANASVDTEFVTAKGARIAITFHLHVQDGLWKVYDVNAAGVSLVENYRAQVGQILRHHTFDELIGVLRAKLAPLERR